MQNWVVVMRHSNGIEYQIYEHEGATHPPKIKWQRKLRDSAGAILTNLVWWWLTS